ncbi:polysaccharide pyruvyl transferase family protein [Oribacterium sp. FC2011]|uniref:polysaccharide pyruvyl transferase family protein n=1 Tax=Oribacterium sp. FC2011 TaxID=1408311 RepID=UPI0005D24401|nr:polysaccharide pyruvyl transferase family protein [Oribacterium sp. FC2011]
MRISIIIPAWNVEKYIVKCIDSCLRIKGAEIEIVIVNDGSTDSTLRKINENFGELNNLKVYTTENHGLSAARNYGIKMAEGDYIIFLDADDWLRTDLNQLISNETIFDNLDVLFFCCQMIDEMDENRLYPNKSFPVDFGIYSGEDIFKISRDRYAGSGFFHFAWLGVYKRSFLLENNISFLEGIVYEDYDFWFKVLRNANRIRYSYRICYAYRLRNASITHVGFSERVLDSIFKTMNSVLNVENASDAYLACAAAKLELLTIYGEMRTSTKNAEYLTQKIYEKGIEEKQKLFKLIERKYPEKDQDWIRIKYRILSHVVFCFGIYDEEMLGRLWNIYEKMNQNLIGEMKKWGLSDGTKRVGFYGHDLQDDIVANTYTELLGDIKADCVYIDDSVKSHRLKHYNRDIININDIEKEHIDEVIVCSNYLLEEMQNRLEEMHPRVKVVSPYFDSRISLLWVVCGNYTEIFKKMQATDGKKRILLFETPEYPNVGDHLIAVSEKQFLHTYFPKHEIIEITNDEYSFYKCRLKRIIRKSDILIITGGGFFGGMWRQFHYDQALDIISGYPDNEVFVMPQSVYFEKTEEGEKYIQRTKIAFDRKHLKVVCREHFSYEELRRIGVDRNAIYQCPDIAFYWKFNKKIDRKESIGMFFRYDKESVMEKKEREKIETVLVYSGLELIHSSMQYGCEKIYKQERELTVEEKLEEIAGYRVVITDQLHCMISCAITRTPCIAFNNISRKLEGVYEYLKDYPYIKFLSDSNHLQDILDELIRLDTSEMSRPDFSQDWDKLAEFLKMSVDE